MSEPVKTDGKHSHAGAAAWITVVLLAFYPLSLFPVGVIDGAGWLSSASVRRLEIVYAPLAVVVKAVPFGVLVEAGRELGRHLR